VTTAKIQPNVAIERPWEGIPPRVAELLRPAVPRMSDAVIAAIRERVPAYRRPLRGRFGTGIRRGVEEALAQFVDLIAEPGVDRAARDEVYRGLGRGEFRERRSLDSLLAAYRLGARVAWRHVAALAIDSRLDRKTLALLAEAVFAYIDELSALSVEGYAEAQSAAAGEMQRRRRQLAALLLAEGPVDEDAAREAARHAGWEPPAKLAALAWAGGERRLLARLPAGSLTLDPDGDAPGISLVPDPEAPRRRAELERAARDSRAALGPPVPWLEAAASARRALTARRLMSEGVIEAGDGIAFASDHLAELVAHGDESLIQDLAARRLEPLDAETPASRRRLTETLRSWLDHQGEITRVADELHVHPQTVRYRLGRLRERLGDALDDPRARFELALALRAREAGGSE
jgi:PucR C-terminal helix-turn-helix domain